MKINVQASLQKTAEALTLVPPDARKGKASALLEAVAATKSQPSSVVDRDLEEPSGSAAASTIAEASPPRRSRKRKGGFVARPGENPILLVPRRQLAEELGGIGMTKLHQMLNEDPEAPKPLKVGRLTMFVRDDVERFKHVLVDRAVAAS
ncbi:MAG: hypothetical protein AAF850_10600 [Pseudomonadota bacterium]